MKYLYSDLHIHSRYARATSKHLNVLNLYKWAKIKGISLLGTGDILHPKWREEFKKYTIEDDNSGFYKVRPEYQKEVDLQLPKSVVDSYVYFVPTVETSHIYKQGDKVRRVHLVSVFPTFDTAAKAAVILGRYSRIDADGRPIFGIHIDEFVKMMLEISERVVVFPAHAWTPHFAVFGSKSGFDSLSEAFGDMARYITALETGLSSDPEMNRLVSALDPLILVSNSDAHSLMRIGREANIHSRLDTYDDLLAALRTGEGLVGTIEYYPEEGRYHYDGHRACGVVLHPKESVRVQNICPKCGKKLTLGVLHRVYDLADRSDPNLALLERFKSVHLVPLDDVLQNVLNVGKGSKKLVNRYFEVIDALGSELAVLNEVDTNEIKEFDAKLGCAIEKMRRGNLKISPGYDGLYGVVKIPMDDCTQLSEQNLRLPL